MGKWGRNLIMTGRRKKRFKVQPVGPVNPLEKSVEIKKVDELDALRAYLHTAAIQAAEQAAAQREDIFRRSMEVQQRGQWQQLPLPYESQPPVQPMPQPEREPWIANTPIYYSSGNSTAADIRLNQAYMANLVSS